MKRIYIRHFLLILLLTCCLPLLALSAVPKASDGVLDLSSWDISSDPLVKLSGQWNFYPEKLVQPKSLDLADYPNTSRLAEVPGSWDLAAPGEETRVHGYGSYALKVLLPDLKNVPIAIQLNDVITAYRFWINGEIVAERGIVGEKFAASVASMDVDIIDIDGNGKELDLLLQVSNTII